MFDMTAITLGSNLTSPMSGNTGQMGSMTPSSGIKFTTHSSPHSNINSPMSTPGSTSNSIMSNGKSLTNSDSKDGILINENELFGSKCKRKINFSHLGIPKGHQPATVARRNARERNRVKQVNNGFSALKQHIPLGHRSKKMSKVETLKCAVEYIKNLKGMLDLNGALLSVSNMSASSIPSSINSNSSNESNDQNHFGANGDYTATDSDTLAHLSHHNHQHFSSSTTTVPAGSHQLSPTSSDDPSSPSYASEASYITSSTSNNNNNANMYDYENYEPVSPEDEELLDAISWWQQS